MEEIFTFIDNLSKRLARPIKDLDDVRGSMSALSEIREAEIRCIAHKFIEIYFQDFKLTILLISSRNLIKKYYIANDYIDYVFISNLLAIIISYEN